MTNDKLNKVPGGFRFKPSTLADLLKLAALETVARGEKVHQQTLVEEAVELYVQRLKEKHSLV
ncbi:hypothetical protein LA345_40875 (plasmid) [Burkholderia vietnamiensis]|nr:hypothetical protein [Burkholderia vietnamiensis]